jgi:hypothetical protein
MGVPRKWGGERQREMRGYFRRVVGPGVILDEWDQPARFEFSLRRCTVRYGTTWQAAVCLSVADDLFSFFPPLSTVLVHPVVLGTSFFFADSSEEYILICEDHFGVLLVRYSLHKLFDICLVQF